MKRLVKEVKTFLFHKDEYEFVKYDWNIEDIKGIMVGKGCTLVDDDNNKKMLDMIKNNSPIKYKLDEDGILIGAEAMYMDTENNTIEFGKVSLSDLKYTLQARDVDYCYMDIKSNVYISRLTPKNKLMVVEYNGEKVQKSGIMTGLYLNVIDYLNNINKVEITATYNIPDMNSDTPILYGNLTAMKSIQSKEELVKEVKHYIEIMDSYLSSRTLVGVKDITKKDCEKFGTNNVDKLRLLKTIERKIQGNDFR